MDESNAYRVEVRVKNNIILRRIKAAGFKSVSAFCRTYQLQLTSIIAIVNFRVLPLTDSGEWREPVWQPSSALRCEPEDLFTDRQRALIAKRRVAVIELSEAQFVVCFEQGKLEQSIVAKDMVRKLLPALTQREGDVIRKRFVENATLEEVAEDLNSYRQRIQQIEAKAIRKLRIRHYKIQNEQRKKGKP